MSFGGLLALAVGFFFTSVCFWQVAGFSFASVFTRRFGLDTDAAGRRPHLVRAGPLMRQGRGYSDPYNAARISAARVSPVVPGDILFMM